MTKDYFEVIRSGINTTFQDLGRKNLYHIGIPFSGAMDNRNFILANPMTPVIEGFRNIFLNAGQFSIDLLLYSIISSISIFIIGLLIFYRVERNFIDTV